jgi:hypothetical protein
VYADSREATEVQGAGAEPLQGMWPTQGLHATLSAMPYLLSGIGFAG